MWISAKADIQIHKQEKLDEEIDGGVGIDNHLPPLQAVV
jgi:hypothetical protein